MTGTIHKYPLTLMGRQTVLLPTGAEILCVQVQRNTPCLWARVVVDAPVEPRDFRIAGTGDAIGLHEGRYLGTVQLDGGTLVFHVFETTPPVPSNAPSPRSVDPVTGEPVVWPGSEDDGRVDDRGEVIRRNAKDVAKARGPW